MKLRLRYIYTILVFGFAIIACNNNKPVDQNSEPTADEKKSILDVIDDLNARINNNPENADLYQERAVFYIEQEEFTQAFKDITTALEIDSLNANYHITLSDVYLGMGKLQKTLQSLEKAIKLDENNTEAFLKMAEMTLVIRDYDKTLYYIDRALKIDELESKGYLLRGVVMIENGDTIRGIKNFMKAIDVNQDYFEANLQLGILYAAKKNDLAIDYFNNAINISPGNIDVMYYLAMFYQETGRYENAIQQYNLILENDPDFFISFYNIGYINLVHFSDYETAIEYFTKAIEINPEYAEAYYNRGFAYELLKDVENSKKDYLKTLELHANYEKAIDGLNRIDEYLHGSPGE